MNEFIKERFSYFADNKKEKSHNLKVPSGFLKKFLMGSAV